MRRPVILALTLIAALGGSAVAAPRQQTGTLARGGSYVVRPDASSSVAALSLWFRAPSSGYDNATPGIAQLALAACAATRLSGGKSLVDQVRALGGRLAFGGSYDMASVDISVPAGSARRALAALTAAYFAPRVDDDAYKLALRDTAVRGVERRYNGDAATLDAVTAAIFASGPAHYPSLPGSADALTAIPSAAVGAYAARTFRSTNAILTLAGHVDASVLDAVTDGDPGGAPMAAPIDSTLAPPNTTVATPGIVPAIGIGFPGSPIADQRASTALDFIADYLFDSDAGTVTATLAKSKANVYGHFVTLHDPGISVVSITGGDLDTAEDAVLSAVAAMQRPLDRSAFAAAIRGFAYRSARNSSAPEGIADDIAWYAIEGAPTYAPGYAGGTYAQTIASLDPQFVAGVARRYLTSPTIVRLVVEKGTSS